jgi:ETFB lysine methyltransferase
MSAALRDRFVVTDESLQLGGWAVTITKPRSAEDLISEADFDQDERLPYWADLWPSAAVLADRVLQQAAPAWRALELGCGLGLASLAARRRGLDVLATDYYEDALLFAALNAEQNGVAPLATRHADWRAWPADLRGFDLILGADILYERPMGALVAEVVAVALAPGGRAWISDPGRVGAETFTERCAALGLRVERDEALHPADAERRIALFTVTRAGEH